jgi:hypothetical protein
MDDEAERRMRFEGLVLSGIWLLVRFAAGQRPTYSAAKWRSNAIGHMDLVGLQHDEAKAYRRSETFPELQGANR